MTPDERLDALTEQALAELEEELSVPDRLPGDIDTQQIAKRLGCSYGAARDKMTIQTAVGNYTVHEVRNPVTGKKVKVYRKAV